MILTELYSPSLHVSPWYPAAHPLLQVPVMTSHVESFMQKPQVSLHDMPQVFSPHSNKKEETQTQKFNKIVFNCVGKTCFSKQF